MNNKINLIKYSALYLLFTMFLTLLITSILFFFHISITNFSLILSLIGSFIIINFLTHNINVTIKSSIIALLCFTLFLGIASTTFDRSSDGNTYHKDAIGNLKTGWNPVYESSKTFAEKEKIKGYYSTTYTVWKDHYAKANWILEASVYKLTNNIESAKVINFIFMYIAFGLIFSYLFIRLKSLKISLIISLISVINPVTVAQMFTFYNDQLVLTTLFALILSLVAILDNKYKISKKEKWLTYGSLFIILNNLKFNALGYSCIFSFIFMVYILYIAYKKNNLKETFFKLFKIYIVLFGISIFVVGFSTYVKNTIDHQQPFFPLYGEHAEDIITAQQPKEFKKMTNISKLFIGTFSKVNNLQNNRNYTLKIPFSISKDEIIPSFSVDTRLSGWGLFSSGLYIISIIIIGYFYIKKKKEKPFVTTIISLITMSTIILLLILQEGWWARYTPHMYLFIIEALLISYLFLKSKLVNIFFTLLICLNTIIPMSANIYYTFKGSLETNKTLSNLKNENIVVYLPKKISSGALYNLKDYDIKYTVSSKVKYTDETLFNYIKYKKKKLD